MVHGSVYVKILLSIKGLTLPWNMLGTCYGLQNYDFTSNIYKFEVNLIKTKWPVVGHRVAIEIMCQRGETVDYITSQIKAILRYCNSCYEPTLWLCPLCLTHNVKLWMIHPCKVFLTAQVGTLHKSAFTPIENIFVGSEVRMFYTQVFVHNTDFTNYWPVFPVRECCFP